MDIFGHFIDFVLHVDRYIEAFVQLYDSWIYLLLFVIIFLEAGVVITPFLPGDSLLFVVGGLCAVGLMNWVVVCALLSAAGALGGQFNYWMGSRLGQTLLLKHSKWFGEKEFHQTQEFYTTYGSSAIVIARFVPFIRTFAPFVAGMGQMTLRSFTLVNVLGALIWVFGVVSAGYALGNVPWVKGHIEVFIWGLVLGPSLLAIWGSFKMKGKDRQQP
jgi:membrane-associated protein